MGEVVCSWALLRPIELAHHIGQPTLLYAATNVLAQFRVGGLCYSVGFRSRSTGVEITSGELFCVEVAGEKELNLTQMEYNHYGRR